MRPYVVSPSAADDLHHIWSYLTAEPGFAHAEEVLSLLIEEFVALADRPGLGHLRQDLTSLPLHFHAVRPYLIVYSRDSVPLAIPAVLHGARDIPALLRNRPLPA